MDWSAYISAVRIDTEYGPPILLDHPFAKTQKPNPLLSALKPQLTIYPTDTGLKPVILAPYGRPGVTKWPQIEAGAVLVGALALGLIVAGSIAVWRSGE